MADHEEPLVAEQQAEPGAESSFPPERSGHVAVTDGTRMFVWGGYKNAPVEEFYDFYLPRDEIWIYDMVNWAAWQKRKTKGNVPPAMSGSCAACVDGVLYLFGGHHDNGNTNMLFMLNLIPKDGDLYWEKLECKGTPPSPKDKLGVWVYQNKLIFFGGYGYYEEEAFLSFEFDESSIGNFGLPRGWNNQVHALHLDSLTWQRIVTTGESPSPRAAHACATVENRGYVFGGRYRDFRMNDLYYLNLDTWVWQEVIPRGVIPVGRSWHTLTLASQDTLFLFGGFTTNKQPLSDSWMYSIKMNRWIPFQSSHAGKPRLWHTACASKEGEIIVFGGCANNPLTHDKAAHSNATLVFPVQPRSLLRLTLETVVAFRELLSGSLDSLPQHLLRYVRRRLASVNTCGS
ncbi:kelch domain-containing protein 2 [Bufo bufo]|uniref:kelch domain-containing protein 2 n=1 Tax=Bufo bufo TaxID=8384 RepID=UPI001ABE2B0E|nr:kelch domain-containing protein 2 [Bufo bufo]